VLAFEAILHSMKLLPSPHSLFCYCLSEQIPILKSILFSSLPFFPCFLVLDQSLKHSISVLPPSHSARNFMQKTPQLSLSHWLGIFGVSHLNVLNWKGIVIFLFLYNSVTNASTSFSHTSNIFLYTVSSPFFMFNVSPFKLFRNWNFWLFRFTTRHT